MAKINFIARVASPAPKAIAKWENNPYYDIYYDGK